MDAGMAERAVPVSFHWCYKWGPDLNQLGGGGEKEVRVLPLKPSQGDFA
jgi:hypothetical protein